MVMTPTNPRMRALSLWQPWVTAIIRGTKRIENRTWPCPPAVLGEPIALHAGLGFDPEAEVRRPLESLFRLPRSRYGHGAIVGVATVVRVVQQSDDPWFEGPYGWVLRNVQAIEPFTVRGRQRLWRLTAEHTAEVYRRLDRISPLAELPGGPTP